MTGVSVGAAPPSVLGGGGGGRPLWLQGAVPSAAARPSLHGLSLSDHSPPDSAGGIDEADRDLGGAPFGGDPFGPGEHAGGLGGGGGFGGGGFDEHGIGVSAVSSLLGGGGPRRPANGRRAVTELNASLSSLSASLRQPRRTSPDVRSSHESSSGGAQFA